MHLNLWSGLNRFVLFILFFKIYFIEVQLIYNIVLISTIYKSDSVIYSCIYTYIYIIYSFHIIFNYNSKILVKSQPEAKFDDIQIH